jgi:hypothetical protein
MNLDAFNLLQIRNFLLTMHTSTRFQLMRVFNGRKVLPDARNGTALAFVGVAVGVVCRGGWSGGTIAVVVVVVVVVVVGSRVHMNHSVQNAVHIDQPPREQDTTVLDVCWWLLFLVFAICDLADQPSTTTHSTAKSKESSVILSSSKNDLLHRNAENSFQSVLLYVRKHCTVLRYGISFIPGFYDHQQQHKRNKQRNRVPVSICRHIEYRYRNILQYIYKQASVHFFQ